MTYYKYAERNVANQMDWSVVNKEITQTLQEEAKLREQKKADIDEASRQFGRVLNEAPMGENQGVNQWALDYSASAQDAMLSLDRELKSGNMSLRDYTKKRQALLDGTDAAFGLIQEYQAEYKKNVEAYQKGEMSYQGMWQMGLLDGLSNFSETGLYINPTDYSVSVGKKVFNEKTGMYELSTNPNDLSSVNTLRNRLKTITPKFDVDGNLKAGANVLGEEIRVLKSRGVLTLSDITQRKEYKDAENNFIKSQMVDPNNVGSILTDHDKTNKATGQQWDYTRDPEAAKKDPNLILMIPDPANPASGRLVPKLTPEQEKAAEDFLRNRLRTMLDVKETPTETIRPTQSDYARGDARRKAEVAVNMVGKMYYGTDQEVAAASQYFAGNNPNILSITRDGTGIKITYKDGTVSPISFTQGGQQMTQEDFIKSATELTGNMDITTALKKGSYNKGAAFNPDAKGSYERTQPTSGTKGFTEKNLLPDKDIKPLSDEFERKLSEVKTNFWGNTSATTVAKAAESMKFALDKLPSSLTKGMNISEVGGTNKAVKVIMPSVTDQEIVIPFDTNDVNTLRSRVSGVTRYLYDLAALGGEYDQTQVYAIIGGQTQPASTNTTVTGGNVR